MNRFIRNLLLPTTLISLLLAACNTIQPTLDLIPTSLQPTAAATAVDTDEIAAEVLAQVQAQLATETSSVPVSYPAATTLISTDLESALINLYEIANPATVYIIAPLSGTGSGFVYSSDGYIVTNNHVVSGNQTFEVVFANGQRRTAALVGADVDSDLAVIQVDSLPEGVQPLVLGDSAALKVGQFAVAIGNPFGEQGSMSLGIISGLDRRLTSQRIENGNSYSLPAVIQTDTPINPGNSGGPLLNLDGAVVGINSAIISTTGTNSGVGFAIPVDAVKQIVPMLISNGRYSYPYMGAAFDDEITLSEQGLYGLSQTQGTYVLNVVAGSPADEAGLIAADPNTGRGGDLIIAIDGLPIGDFNDLNSYLVFHTAVGQTIDITIIRAGETLTLPLTLGERP